MLGVSKTTVRNDRCILGIRPRPQGQPSKSPLPDERNCDTCGEVFRPRRENVKQGGGRFCCKACVPEDSKRRDASRAFVRKLNRSRAESIARLTADGDLLTREQAAGALGVTAAVIDHYLRHGYLACEEIAIGRQSGDALGPAPIELAHGRPRCVPSLRVPGTHAFEQKRPPPCLTFSRRGRKTSPQVSQFLSSGSRDLGGGPGAGDGCRECAGRCAQSFSKPRGSGQSRGRLLESREMLPRASPFLYLRWREDDLSRTLRWAWAFVAIATRRVYGRGPLLLGSP